MKNRLFVSYSAPTGMDCKMIGPETPCFCTHRYKQHKTDFEVIPTDRPIKLPCRQRGCKCATYHFAPLNGSQPIRCTCKHTSEEHSEEQPYRCKKRGCIKCTGFTSSFTCGCGGSYKQHKMIVETAEEREARGHPIGQATPYAAMGGITGFSSLADGYMRLDPSGRGIDDPDDEIFSDLTERVSQMKRPGEADMDYYERRYQEKKAGGRANVTDSYGQLGAGTRKAIDDKPRSNFLDLIHHNKCIGALVCFWFMGESIIFFNLALHSHRIYVQCSDIQSFKYIVDPSVSLQPSSVFGLMFTNTQSPAQFNSLLTKSVDSKITESMHETNQLTISSIGVIKNSDFVEQLSSSINENDIVPSKTISSDVSEKSKLMDQSLALASSIQIMYASSSNDVDSSSSRSFGITDLTSSSKDVPQITASHLSMGNDPSLSSTSSSSIVMVTAAYMSTNSFTDVKETSRNVAISNFAQTNELTFMSSTFSGEINLAQSKASDFTATIDNNILPTSVLESNSAVSIEISSTKQTYKSEHMLESSIGILSNDVTHSLQTSNYLPLEQTSSLSTMQMTDTSAQSSQLAMTNIPTKDFNNSVIPSTIDNIPKTSNLNTVVPTSSSQPSMQTISLSDLSMTAPLTVSNLMESLSSTSSVQRIELTQSVVNETNTLSSILEREITPSETFTVLTTPSGGSFISKIEHTASQDMMSITSSLVITTPQLNVSDFETKSLLSSDLRIFTSTMANSQSSSLEQTSQNVEQSTISTSLISTTPQTNISAFNTQSLLPSELGSSTLGLVNQSSTPEMMQSSPTKNMSSLSIFDLGSTFTSDSIFLTLNVSNIQSSMPIFQTSDLINASDSSTFQILPTPVMTISSDSSFMLNISNVQTSTTVDLSSEFLMFNATPTVISSTQTQNFSDSLLPDFVSTIFGSSQSLNQSENSINATSVSQSMYFPMTLTSEANFSSGTFLISSSSFPATLPMMNFSSSLE
ncbi:Hypothetical predicted protein [Mytilus galloprovincialis]|uniref:Protein FAM221A n=1 Tax=Mytilus galloprovincialis TaxID=29158 RepID=A0A8B6C4A0_MYTGA|nr:Hypothetical predicted protein [Mytilus galloprovincialis]